MRKKGTLILSDGTRYEGEVFGAEAPANGEVVFSTAMTGYTESLTDPSFEGQILVSTYPLVGNYGLPAQKTDPETGLTLLHESPRIHVSGFIVHDYCEGYSHWNAVESLEEGLKRNNVTGLTGIDTRALTQKLRDHGPLMGKIVVEGHEELPFVSIDDVNLVAKVSTKEVITYRGTGDKTVVLIDCGVKENILRHLIRRGLTVIRVPWDYDFSSLEYDGLFISNGPGNPNLCTPTIEHVREAIKRGDKPIAGICMGNQIIARAIGATVIKMKYGHRSHNQPVQMAGTTRCYITSQNHGFAVDDNSLPKGWKPYFVNLNDGTNEGLIHESGRIFSVQFHPEACSGPTDTEFIFDDFVALLN